jgi:hypothetical protein
MKYVKHLNSDELLERIAEDLVQMHLDTGIDLAYWETAMEIVGRFYYTSINVNINGKINK